MIIKKETGSYLKHKSRTYLMIAVIYSALILLLFITSIKSLPFYIDARNNEFSFGAYTMLFLVLIIISVKEYRKYNNGFYEEKRVTSYLTNQFNDDYYLIHDTSALDTYGNIDYIILAPNGLFTLETRNNRGNVTLYGEYWDFGRSPVKQAKINAFKTSDMVASSNLFDKNPCFQEIVVFLNAELFFNPKPETPVLKLEEVPDYIKLYMNGDKRYSPEYLENIRNEILKQVAQSVNIDGNLIFTIREWLAV
jgi:hypothetical protein